MTHPEIELEQAHVDRAYARLEILRDAARDTAARVAAGPVVSAPHGLLERDALFYARRDRYVALSIGDEPLVFGRIDTRDKETFHIGRVGVTDEDHTRLVVDWRAPAAAAFYRATPGDPGIVVRRRHLHCRAQKVLSLDDELLDATDEAAKDLVLVGEAALLRAVGRARTGRMRDIVSTIQVEQDKVIRAPLEGILVVQGGPGTGKTAVGLHRAAYLLYTHRNKLERSGVLLVGPDPIFLRYVEHVLPSLGESAVRMATTSDLMEGVTATATDAPDAARLKGDLRMIKVVRRAIRYRQRGIARPVRILHGGEMLELTPEATDRIAERVSKMRGTHNERRRALETAVLLHVLDLYRAEMTASYRAGRRGPSPWGTNVAKEERVEFFEAMLEDERVVTAIDEMWPVLSPQRLIRELYASDDALRYATSGSIRDAERGVLARTPDQPWTNADVPLLDEARVLLGPPTAPRVRTAELDEEERWMIERMLDDLSEVDPIIASERGWLAERYLDARSELDRSGRGGQQRRTFGHVIVDEAQDLSPMQWRMIARRNPSRSMTILGDLAQGTSVWAPESWEDALSEVRSKRAPNVTELTINYRTPTQIMDAANRVIADVAKGLTRPQSVRDGEPPRFVDTTAEQLERVAAETAIAERRKTDGTVAIIAPPALVGTIRSHLEGAGDTEDLDAPIVVLEVARAKGLEFDSVVVVEPARVMREFGPRALYVTLTRPTQTLTVVHAEPLPEALVPTP